MMAEISFEYLALALEATRFTAVTPPTHYLNLKGMIVPKKSKYAPDENRGILAARPRSITTRKWAEWDASGGLDAKVLPVFANMMVQVVTAPTTPAGAILSRLWTFTRAMTTNTLKTATFYGGDPAVQIFQGAGAIAKEMSINADGSGTAGTTFDISGVANFPTKVSAPSLPAQIIGGLIVPLDVQLWLDTTSAIGTTAITGRVVAASHTIPSGLQEKFLVTGPAGSRTYGRVGVAKTTPTTTITLELLDTAQYDLFQNDTAVKLRVRHNGVLIETTAGPVDWYEYVEVDGYGTLSELAWEELEGTNRTVSFTLEHEYLPAIASDLLLKVQNDKTSL